MTSPSTPYQPTPEELHRASRGELVLHSYAPWYDLISLDDEDQLHRFADADGRLPLGIPLAALRSFEWRRRIAVRDSREHTTQYRQWRGGRWYRVRDGITPRRGLILAVLAKMTLLQGSVDFDPSWDYDLWCARSVVEFDFLGNFDRVTRPRLQHWATLGVVADVHQDAVLWVHNVLPTGYQQIPRRHDPLWGDRLHYERRARSEWGVFLGYHSAEADQLNRHAARARYPVLPTWWPLFEMPQGFWSLSSVITAYFGSHMMRDPASPYWVAHVTQYIVGIAVALVWDAYDTGRLWYCPPRVIDALRRLDLSLALGAEGNSDLSRFLDKIESTRWELVPFANNCRGQGRNESPGRTAVSGDFIFFDPETGETLSAFEARRRRDVRQDPFGQSSFDSTWRRAYNQAPRTFAEAERQNTGASSNNVPSGTMPTPASTRPTPRAERETPSSSWSTPMQGTRIPTSPRGVTTQGVRNEEESQGRRVEDQPPTPRSQPPSPRVERREPVAGSSAQHARRARPSTPSGNVPSSPSSQELPEPGSAAYERMARENKDLTEARDRARQSRRRRHDETMPQGTVIDVDAELSEEGDSARARKRPRSASTPMVDLTCEEPDPLARDSLTRAEREARRRRTQEQLARKEAMAQREANPVGESTAVPDFSLRVPTPPPAEPIVEELDASEAAVERHRRDEGRYRTSMRMTAEALEERIFPLLKVLEIPQPPDGYPPSGPALIEFLREELQRVQGQFRRGGIVNLVRTIRRRFKRTTYRLSRENALAFHYLLEEIMDPPPGGFAFTVEGLRAQLVEFALASQNNAGYYDQLGFEKGPL